MTAQELRQKFLDFFKNKGHAVLASASLIPENDPTTLFISAGMHPLVPYLMGEAHPQGKRLASVQKCIRTRDIDQVGDGYHHTFFEMLGNWSLGDYFKKEAIAWSYEFLTKHLNIPMGRLAISVFKGDQDAPLDRESISIWRNVGIPEERIVKLGKDDNWWGPAGQTGPCGPDTEIFFWNDNKNPAPKNFDPKNTHWVEIWNDVFMEYDKTAEGRYEPLKQKNVDTGMGLERTLAVLNGLADDYQTELFINQIRKIEESSGKKYGESEKIIKAMRIIVDHIKAVAFIMADDKGILPSNLDQGYVIRRLIRRAVRYGRQLEIENDLWTKEIARAVIEDYQGIYPELGRNKGFILDNLDKEEAKFKKTLEKGLRELEKMRPKKLNIWPNHPKSFLAPYELSGDKLFNLYSTYGFPIEMSLEELKRIYQEFNCKHGSNIKLSKYDEDRILQQFHTALEKHQELSRTAASGKFKSGLADTSEETKKLHTAAHLLLAALRKVLGEHVLQKGSNITAERLRFDFSHNEKMTDGQKQEVEKIVNEVIRKDLPVKGEEMSLDEAKKQGAMGVFESKYGDKVKVYSIGDFSKEICAGPHAEQTGQLGHFKITKEQSSGAGVRRIKAILE
ncbi:MAG: alanine--tRNA ligase [Candidatus Portnoybacteria bacterium CG03_land_8_20_14_0_80_41_10]|uniref:Alanine--tRNA ligase n=1 Tax=Candidatus Portnoybacteria bacterium CG03_land_8_20_14_0_80_41_10 TaxID=1974808 RepID=A0A2M7BV19_9BACT|nr:MAG: alanine--tRNA ligase [Candidatus Portnoybacteria bacterium CG03_land_8_20_14_0_80_41_10]